MPWYTVYGSVTVIGWATVEADSPERAFELAQEVPARDFNFDIDTAEVEFNVDPQVDEF